jgi:hypothetical protein
MGVLYIFLYSELHGNASEYPHLKTGNQILEEIFAHIGQWAGLLVLFKRDLVGIYLLAVEKSGRLK